MKHGVISRNVGDKGSCWPSVARLADGRIAAVWSGGRMAHVCPFGRVDISYSTNGEDWSPAATIFDSPLDDRDAGVLNWNGKTVLTTFNNSVSFQRSVLNQWKNDPEKGKFIEAYLNMVSDVVEEKYLGALLSVSDNGQDFNSFQKLPITSPHGPTVLRNGSLLYVGRSFSGTQTWKDASLPDGIYGMRSSDGVNWDNVVKIPEGEFEGCVLCEPHAVECADGKILVAVRVHTQSHRFSATTEDGLTIGISESADGGKSFSPLKDTGSMGSPPHLLRLKNGNIVMTYGRRVVPFGIRARISSDNGNRWGEEIVLRNDGISWDMGYPASVELDNGEILSVYYIKQACEHLARIEYTIWK